MEDSWALYPAVGPPGVNPRFSLPDDAEIIQAFDDAVNRYVAREIDPVVRDYRARLEAGGSPETANELGILLGKHGLLRDAWAQFSVCAKAPRVYGWTNLANVAFLRGDYALAVSYFEWALQQDPRNPVALLGIARSSYEMERFDRAGAAYADLAAVDPGLAAEYGYLASSLGGTGRAWSFADRLGTTMWDEPGRAAPALAARPTPEEPPATVEQPAVSEPPAQKPQPEPQPEPQLAAVAETPRPAPRVVVGRRVELPDSDPVQAGTAPIEAPIPQLKALPPTPPPVVPAPPAPAPPAQAPPKIAQELPVDKDVVAAAAVRVVTVQAAPKQAEPAPAPVPPPAPPTPAPPPPPPSPAPPPTPAPSPPPPPAPPPPSEPVVVAAAPPVEQEPSASFEGFGGAVRYMGRWTVQKSSARQTDETALTAKLAVPLAQAGGPLRYTVTAQSQGSGWVGVGLHVLVSSAEKHRGWGEGRSILAWLTSDPKHRGDTFTRLQLYRSESDIDMTLVDEVIVPESVFDRNEISVRLGSEEGVVSVSLNGTPRLSSPGFGDLSSGVTVVFRSIDKAEFQDFRVEELR